MIFHSVVTRGHMVTVFAWWVCTFVTCSAVCSSAGCSGSSCFSLVFMSSSLHRRSTSLASQRSQVCERTLIINIKAKLISGDTQIQMPAWSTEGKQWYFQQTFLVHTYFSIIYQKSSNKWTLQHILLCLSHESSVYPRCFKSIVLYKPIYVEGDYPSQCVPRVNLPSATSRVVCGLQLVWLSTANLFLEEYTLKNISG